MAAVSAFARLSRAATTPLFSIVKSNGILASASVLHSTFKWTFADLLAQHPDDEAAILAMDSQVQHIEMPSFVEGTYRFPIHTWQKRDAPL